MKQLIIIFSILLIFISCQNQVKQSKELKLTEFKFESIFGSTPLHPKSTYCILGTGFFRTPQSNDSDSIITNWLKSHPKAIVIPVSSFGPIVINDPESKMVYCWIVDQNDTLNNYLIKEGCFPGGTMIRPKTKNEMKKWEKKLYEDSSENINIQVFVNKQVYNNFIEQIKKAELSAKKEKLRIWQDDFKEK